MIPGIFPTSTFSELWTYLSQLVDIKPYTVASALHRAELELTAVGEVSVENIARLVSAGCRGFTGSSDLAIDRYSPRIYHGRLV